MPDYRQMAADTATKAAINATRFSIQIGVESINYDIDVIECRQDSPAGARGIAQLMPVHWTEVDPCNPQAALTYAANLMAGHLDYWAAQGYDDTMSWVLALASYNAGRQGTINGLAGISPGWPFTETVNYVTRIMGLSTSDTQYALKRGSLPSGVTNPQPMDTSALTAFLDRVVALGMLELGKPYSGPVIGQPESYRRGTPGYDCSSFVEEMFEREYGGTLFSWAYTDTMSNESTRVAAPIRGTPVYYHYSDDSQPNTYFPHMGIWLSATEVLDCRYSDTPGKGGVAVRPHLLPVTSTSGQQFRITMLPNLLVVSTLPPVVVTPPSQADPIAVLNDTISGLRTAVAYLADVVVPKGVDSATQRESVLAEAKRVREQFVGPKPEYMSGGLVVS